MSNVHLLILSAGLTWLMVLTAGLVRSRGWTAGGLKFAFGNRQGASEISELAGRADRAAKNMLENMIIFVALFVAGRFAGKENGATHSGIQLFFWARLAYWPVYLIGIPYLRTAIWAVSVVGLFQMALSIW